MQEDQIQRTKEHIERFVKENSPLIIVNTSTGRGLVCLSPKIDRGNGSLMIRFDSLNERGGNSVHIAGIHSQQDDHTIYLETDEDNIIMLQKMDTGNYIEYIKKEYFNAPEFGSEEEMVGYFTALAK